MLRLACLLLLHLLLAPTASAGSPWTSAPPPPAEDGAYRLGPGDVVQVQVYGEKELSGKFPVNEAGLIVFPLLGSLDVAERTAAQVAEELRQRLADGFLVEPDVTAWLEEHGSQSVQVLGAVDKPGQVYLRGPTTLLQVLSEAGGVKGEGASELRLTRGTPASDGADRTRVIPLEPLLKRGEGNIPLKAGDVVFVPENLVSVMGQVHDPGDVAFREGMTVSTCVAAAGGALPEANLGRVWIMRGEERIRVNLRRILAGRAPDVPIVSGDRVFVKESPL